MNTQKFLKESLFEIKPERIQRLQSNPSAMPELELAADYAKDMLMQNDTVEAIEIDEAILENFDKEAMTYRQASMKKLNKDLYICPDVDVRTAGEECTITIYLYYINPVDHSYGKIHSQSKLRLTGSLDSETRILKFSKLDATHYQL